MRSTGDPLFDLIAGVYRQAVQDARHGDQKAVEWLDVTASDWRVVVQRKPYRKLSRYYFKKGVAHASKNA